MHKSVYIKFDGSLKKCYNVFVHNSYNVRPLLSGRKGFIMAKYLCNAFSLAMLDASNSIEYLRVEKTWPKLIPQDVVSCVGHADTAKILTGILGFEVPFNRTGIKLKEDDVLYVAQYKGPRLPEGTTTLPEGASFEFLKVENIGGPCRRCCSPCYNMECCVFKLV